MKNAFYVLLLVTALFGLSACGGGSSSSGGGGGGGGGGVGDLVPPEEPA